MQHPVACFDIAIADLRDRFRINQEFAIAGLNRHAFTVLSLDFTALGVSARPYCLKHPRKDVGTGLAISLT